MEHAKSRLVDIRKHLEAEGYDVYFPGQKVDECLKPYVVVKDEGSTQFYQFTSDMRLYAVMVYVPQGRFSELEPMMDAVDKSMQKMYPMIQSNNFQTPSFLDDTVKAHMISSQYRNVRKFRD